MNIEIEAATINILKRGVELDLKERYTEALICYQEALQLLIDKMKEETDESKKRFLKTKVDQYMDRAEEVKKLAQEKEAKRVHKQINIENDSTGHSYQTLFGKYLNKEVEYVIVQDPYIWYFHQCQNFLRLCELCVRKCQNLKLIELTTSKDGKSDSEQKKWLHAIGEDLQKYKIKLIVKYSETLHDRQIILSSGWIIKIGRGLDFYKAPENKFCLGAYDMDLRKCTETTVDIIHSKNVKQSYG